MEKNTKIALGVGAAVLGGGIIYYYSTKGEDDGDSEVGLTPQELAFKLQQQANAVARQNADGPLKFNPTTPDLRVLSITPIKYVADAVEVTVEFVHNAGWDFTVLQKKVKDEYEGIQGKDATLTDWGFCWEWNLCQIEVDFVYNAKPLSHMPSEMGGGLTAEEFKNDKKKREMTFRIPLCMDHCSNDDTYGGSITFLLDGQNLEGIDNNIIDIAYGEESYDYGYCETGLKPFDYDEGMCQ